MYEDNNMGVEQEATANPTAEDLYNACMVTVEAIKDAVETIVEAFKTALDIANDTIDLMLTWHGRKRRKRPPKSIALKAQHFFKKQRVHRCRNNC
jgi:hypothetical protein